MTPNRILVIDDEPGVRDIVRITLEMAGHVVIEATSGETGLTEANRHAPDLILCDVDMPGLDGRKR
jgi:CheY-like chemotaxis protein